MLYYLFVFLLSMVPVLELRFSLPFGYLTWNLNLVLTNLAAILGNLLPVPFILLFIPKILHFMDDHHIFPKLTSWLLKKAERGANKVEKTSQDRGDEKRKIQFGAMIAIFFFVCIPLPGTGAWTGSLIAAFCGIPKKYSILAIALGVIFAGLIVSLILTGTLAFLAFLL